MNTDCVIVWTTIAEGADAATLAATLVRERLAACVNVLGEMDSHYWWKGDVEAARERQLIMKTTAEKVSALHARLHQLHEYDLPEFIVLPVVGGSDAYLAWIRESTRG